MLIFLPANNSTSSMPCGFVLLYDTSSTRPGIHFFRTLALKHQALCHLTNVRSFRKLLSDPRLPWTVPCLRHTGVQRHHIVVWHLVHFGRVVSFQWFRVLAFPVCAFQVEIPRVRMYGAHLLDCPFPEQLERLSRNFCSVFLVGGRRLGILACGFW